MNQEELATNTSQLKTTESAIVSSVNSTGDHMVAQAQPVTGEIDKLELRGIKQLLFLLMVSIVSDTSSFILILCKLSRTNV